MKLFGKIYLIAFSKPRRTSVLSILSYIGLVIILIGSISDRVPMSFGQGNGGSGDGGNGGSGDGGNGGSGDGGNGGSGDGGNGGSGDGGNGGS